MGRVPAEGAPLSLVPQAIAKRHNILPYQYDQKAETVYIATADPLNLMLADFLEKKTGKKIIWCSIR